MRWMLIRNEGRNEEQKENWMKSWNVVKLHIVVKNAQHRRSWMKKKDDVRNLIKG